MGTVASNEDQKIRNFQNVCEILDRHQRQASQLIPILQEVQKLYGYLPQEVQTFIATSLEIPPAKVFGVASFYANFALKPKGKYVILLCDGTACHVKGTPKLLEAVYDKLGLSKDKPTSDDMLFTVETVSCLGACGLSPVLTVNEKVYGQMTPEKVVALIDTILAEDKEK